MNKLKKILSSAFVSFLLFAVPANLFSQIQFLSPVEGLWANKQMLVIDDAADGEYLYSIDGSDPQSFGFAYDGPVLLDVTGEVKLKVVHILSDGKKENAEVEFTVKTDEAASSDYRDFVKTFYDSGILNYSAGSKLSIPQNLLFSFGLPPDSYLTGRELEISSDCVFSRYIPCVIFDRNKDIRYRFIVKIIPQTASKMTQRDVPFSITDWNTISFDNDNYIYKIDSEYWELPKKPKKLDRSVSHMISWQPLEYDPANPVEFFVLPPKPTVEKKILEDGSVLFSLTGDDSYKLSPYLKEKHSYTDFFDKVGIDVFEGDRFNGKVKIGVFSNSVYQGYIEQNILINKRPPVTPEIKTNAKSFYSRDTVNVEISCEKSSELYIALSEPVTLDFGEVPYASDSAFLKNIKTGEFKKNKKNTFKISWNQKGVGPMFYKVLAYSKNENSTSQIVEYSVIIDQSNFYYDKNADSELAEGTAEHPFTDFAQCVSSLVKNRPTNLQVRGELFIDKAYKIESNLKIMNAGEGAIKFAPEGSLQIKGATVDIVKFDIENSAGSGVLNIVPFFKLENAVLKIDDCTFISNFSKNGTLIDSYNSIINISNTIGVVNSVTYASFISGVKSRINLKNTAVSVNSDTAVVISATNGNVNVEYSQLTISCSNGRIAELFGVKAEFIKNRFSLNQSGIKDSVVPIYVNSKTTLVERDNEKNGF